MQTNILPTDTPRERASSISRAASALLSGELVAFPTETVYGLGANALLDEAVRRVFEVKRRPMDNPLIVHVHALRQAMELMQEVPPCFAELAREFWPGPLTLIVRHNAAVSDIVTAGLDTVALRVPDHKVTRELLRMLELPVAAPSANISGTVSPTTADSVYADLSGYISCVLDGGPCAVGIESTVLDLTTRDPIILRPGTVTREDLEDVLQARVFFATDVPDRPASPGMKYRHYAPNAELVLFAHDLADLPRRIADALREEAARGVVTGLLAPDSFEHCGAAHFHSLGGGDAVEYARRIYAGLRTLDTAGCSLILCPALPDEGIGHAVMNRLRKAAVRIVRD